MKPLIGIIMIIAGIGLGIYVGLWVCFIGGIVQIVDAVRAPVLSGQGLAIGIAKVVFASFAGWVSALLLISPGHGIVGGLMQSHKQNRRYRIYTRDKGICQICNRPVEFGSFTLDHIVPKKSGGNNEDNNLQVSHKRCNQFKADYNGTFKVVLMPHQTMLSTELL